MELSYSVKRGEYKYATIRIDNSLQITLNIPLRFKDSDIEKLLKSKKTWIEKTLSKLSKRDLSRIRPAQNEILYLGELYSFERSIGMKKEIMVDDIRKKIYASINLNDDKNLIKFYTARAKFIMPDRVAKLAKEHGITFSKTGTRKTVSRYGSCSSRGVITLSERLILTPQYVIDAIILHELTHIKIMDHSQRFYNELYKICPFYDDADRWLKERMPVSYPPEKKSCSRVYPHCR